jgi:hypothetical protein
MEPPHKKQKASSGAMAYAHIMKDVAQQGLHPDECDMDYKGLKYVNTTVSVVLIVTNKHIEWMWHTPRTSCSSPSLTGKSTRI